MTTSTGSKRIGVLAATALMGAASLSTLAAQDTTWHVQIWGPKRASTLGIEWYAQEVAAKTGGRMKMEVVHGKGGPADSADVLKSGAAEGAYFCAQYYADKMPLSTVIDLPMFTPADLKALGRVELALAEQPAIDAELKQWNTKMLLPTPMPQYQMMGTRRVAKISDLQGAKVRISGEMGKILSEYGATASVTPSDKSAEALRAGTLDLVALPYPYSFASFKIDDASKYVTDKISLGAPLCYLGVSRKAWDALPQDVQKVMLEVRPGIVSRHAGAYGPEDAASIAGFKAKNIEFVDFNPVDRARLLARSIKVWQAWVEEREKHGLKGREVFEYTQAKIKEASASR
jgi:TRAP-type C4-dicarboxylate transport system substrate-binding protein